MSDIPSNDALMLAFSAPAPGAGEAEFNAWYDHTHIPQLIKHASGIVTAQRYRLASTQARDDGTALPYLAIYQIDGDPAGVLRDLGEAQGELTMSPTLDLADRPPVSLIYERIR